MKKISLVPLFAALFIIILVALAVYFGWQIKRQQDRLESVQMTVVDNASKIGAVVNFINSSLANSGAQQQ